MKIIEFEKIAIFLSMFLLIFIFSLHCAEKQVEKRTISAILNRMNTPGKDLPKPAPFNKDLCPYEDIKSVVDQSTWDSKTKKNCLKYIGWDAVLSKNPGKENECKKALYLVCPDSTLALKTLGNKTQIPSIDADFKVPEDAPDKLKKTIFGLVEKQSGMQMQSYNDVISKRNEEILDLQNNKLVKEQNVSEKARINYQIDNLIKSQLQTLSHKLEHNKSADNRQEVLQNARSLPDHSDKKIFIKQVTEQERIEKAEKERIEKAEQERIEKAEQERIEKAEQERIEKAEQERIEKAEQERIEKAEQERIEKAEQERIEKAEKERLEKAEKERLEKERIEKERIEKERLEKERLEKERLEKAEQERIEKAEKERIEKAEKERLEKAEKERLEKERIEKERLEKERLEKERLEKERLEKERLEKAEKATRNKKMLLFGTIVGLSSMFLIFKNFFTEKYADLFSFSPFIVFKT